MRCKTPLVLERKDYFLKKSFSPSLTRFQKVPCGKCLECITNYMMSWLCRLELEARMSLSVGFYTFTYDEEHCPESVSKYDVQCFFKRLRKKYSDDVKYILISEYCPTHTRRPHYHAVIFNTDIDKVRDCWNNGFVTYGDISQGRLMYVLSFHFLKNEFVPEGKNPNFKLMSNKLGLDGYFKFERSNAINNDYRYLITDKGYRVSVPRYFREKDGYKFPDNYFDNLCVPKPLTKKQVDSFNSSNEYRIKKFIYRLMQKKQE